MKVRGPFGYHLREVHESDAPFVLSLRTSEELSRYLNPTIPDLEAQKEWLRERSSKPDDYYFVVESEDGEKEGLISLYGVDPQKRVAEWGRWIVRPGSLAAPASVLLVLNFGFENLGLERIFSRTVEENLAVISFHDRVGFLRGSKIIGGFRRNNSSVDLIEHFTTQEHWPIVKRKLQVYATRVHEREMGSP